MRKLILLAISAAALMFTGCTKEYYTIIKGAETETVILEVPVSAWKYTNAATNNQFFAEIDVPEITKDAFEAGNISVYRIFGSGKDCYQKQLPFAEYYETDKGAGGMWFYSEALDYQVYDGAIDINFTISDFYYEESSPEAQAYVPEAMKFRLVIIHPND